MPLGRLWRDIAWEALERIGGSGSLSSIYNSVEAIFHEAGESDLPSSWQSTIRREIEHNSSDTKSFKHRFDLFESMHGVGSGYWKLRDFLPGPTTTEEIDFADEADRRETYVSRIVRDGRKVQRLKKLHDNTCQLCRTRMRFPDGTAYSEVHHLKPLGRPHSGPDVEKNMIVVCPNCHVFLDFGARLIDPTELASSLHEIGAAFIEYSNSLNRWKVEPIA